MDNDDRWSLFDYINLGWWKVKFWTRRFFCYYLFSHKCEARDCKTRLKGKYRWCSLECYVYCGGSLKAKENSND